MTLPSFKELYESPPLSYCLAPPFEKESPRDLPPPPPLRRLPKPSDSMPRTRPGCASGLMSSGLMSTGALSRTGGGGEDEGEGGPYGRSPLEEWRTTVETDAAPPLLSRMPSRLGDQLRWRRWRRSAVLVSHALVSQHGRKVLASTARCVVAHLLASEEGCGGGMY